MIEGVNPVPPEKVSNYDPTSRQKEESRLKDASKQFEQVFMMQMLKEMDKSVQKSDVFGEGKDEETFKDMLNQERAKAWSESGGVGLAQLIYEQMRSQIADKKPGEQGQDPAGQLEAASSAIKDAKMPSAVPPPELDIKPKE
jgi:flagellar protein FlgJ